MINPFSRTRLGSVRPAVAVEELCIEASEYVDKFEDAEDQRSCVRVRPASGPRTRMLGTLFSSAGENSSRSSKIVVGVSGTAGVCLREVIAEWYESLTLDDERPDLSEYERCDRVTEPELEPKLNSY